MMNRVLGITAIASIAVLVAAPALANSRHHHHYRHPSIVSYLHNYGPGPSPGTYAYYDGPLRANCKQSAAAYRGQNGRAHPCL
jgi:hypothetical protein